MIETARDIDDAAAEWAVRLDEHGEDPAVARAAEAWLEADPRRAGALLRAQAALHLIDRGRALSGPGGAIPVQRLPVVNRRHLLWGGAAGGGLAAGVGGLMVFGAARQRFDTRLGEVRRVPLDDGSVATINTSSRVVVTLQPKVRRVVVADGEAWFKVAKDPQRPFIVEAGRVRVRAVGTAFSVRRLDTGADVLVTEGVVETWTVGDEARKVRISAGSKAYVAEDEQAQPIQPVLARDEIDRALAWRDGEIALHGETLAEAAAEFNRYNARKIVITSSALASERVVGQFRTDEPDSFGKAAATTLDAQYTVDEDSIRLSPRR